MTSAILQSTAGDLITRALRSSRIIATEQPIQDKDFQQGFDAIESVLKHWQAQGIHLWSKTSAIIPLVKDQRKYLLGPGGDEIAELDTFVNTTLTSALIATTTTLPVVSTTGMAGAPNILSQDVTLSTQDWTAINSATLSVSSGILITNGAAVAGGAEFTLDTTIGRTYRVRFGYTKGTSVSAVFTVLNGGVSADTTTLTATGTGELTITALTSTITFRAENTSAVSGETSTVSSLNFIDESEGDRIGIELDDGTRQWTDILDVLSSTSVELKTGLTGAAATSNTVFSYEIQIGRPLRLLNAQFGETITASEIPVNRWSEDEYFDQSDKDSSGTVVNWYYTPSLNLGELFVWQVAANVNQVLRFRYNRPINIPTAQSDLLDIPSEWNMPLQWAIAAEVGPGYGLKAERQLTLELKAGTTLDEALGHDVERDSMLIQPDFT